MGLSDKILKGHHLRNIEANFGLIWFSGVSGEDLNAKVLYYISENKLKFKCSYMAMSKPRYLPEISGKFFFQ
jgi:hypothetical protein